MHKLPFNGTFLRASYVGEIILSYIIGKLEPSFRDHFRYACTFVEDHSRYTYLVFLWNSGDLAEAVQMTLKKFRHHQKKHSVNMELSTSTIQLHSDVAEEYKGQENFFAMEHWFEKSFLPPYTLAVNKIIERFNTTVEAVETALLIQARLPSCLWSFALKHVIFLRNRVQHSTTGTTPFSVVMDERPNLKHIRIFGGTASVLRLSS